VVKAIVERFSDPQTVKRLRDELHRQVKATTGKAKVEGTRKQLAKVEAKLTKAKRRLVEVDRDMLPIVQDQIRELDQRRQELDATLQAAKTPQAALLKKADEKVEQAMALFARLRQTLQRADMQLLRELLAEAVERIEVFTNKRKHGRLFQYDLRGGFIYMKSSNLLASPRPWG
jgi:DNA repair exonuclease SbcCD ATPase subunit